MSRLVLEIEGERGSLSELFAQFPKSLLVLNSVDQNQLESLRRQFFTEGLACGIRGSSDHCEVTLAVASLQLQRWSLVVHDRSLEPVVEEGSDGDEADGENKFARCSLAPEKISQF